VVRALVGAGAAVNHVTVRRHDLAPFGSSVLSQIGCVCVFATREHRVDIFWSVLGHGAD
jgi:hypothetical protein